MGKHITAAVKIDIILNSILERSELPEYISVFNNWSTVVGEEVAEISHPYRVVKSGNKKVLILRSKKGKSLELQHESQKILNKIHNFLGEEVFSQIRIIQIDINESLIN